MQVTRLMCRVLGHSRSRRVWREGAEFHSRCKWCRVALIRTGPKRWEVAGSHIAR